MKDQKQGFYKKHARNLLYSSLACTMAASGAMLLPAASYADDAALADDAELEEVVVKAHKVTYGRTETTKLMLDQQIPGGNVMDVVNNIPGVTVSQGAIFGSDDGSTSISMRGFSTGQDQQQIGMTIDGLPNGNSNYGGGSKANRFIDMANLKLANVSQGTADIGSPSHEALGGTINFITDLPEHEQGIRAKASVGDNNARYYFGRIDTGEMFGGTTTAYMSYSKTTAGSWIGDPDSGHMKRDHFEAKVVTELDNFTFTGRYSWDSANEFDVQRVGLGSFKRDPRSDNKVGKWVGIPFIDQAFRDNGRTIRDNKFSWFKVDYDDGDVKINVTPYYHSMTGRGDWTPARINVVEGGSLIPGSNLSDNGPGTIFGGVKTGEFWYRNADGTPATFIDGCTETLFTFNDGTSSPQRNPACYSPDAIPVMSYRHTHYAKTRLGFTANGETETFNNNLTRIGIWVERADRDEARDVHEIIDPRISNKFKENAYWVQYDRNFITNNIMLYLEDTYETENLVIKGGVKKFYVDLTRTDRLGIQDKFKINSDSDLLFTIGGVYTLNDEVEIFSGFSQGFAPIKSDTIESLTGNPLDTTITISATQALLDLVGETTDNYELGARFQNDWIKASVTAYYIKFSNRITSIPPLNESGFLLSDDDDIFINVGGVESKGVEASIELNFMDYWSAFSSVTYNDSTYTQTKGDIIAGNEVALSPKFSLVGTLAYDRSGFNSGVSGKYSGAHFGDFANAEELPSSIVFDFWAGYAFDVDGNEVKASINVKNIFDEKYLSGGTPRRYNIGIGRIYLASLEYAF
ncbi:MAG: hypothetical protein COB49_11490 [Alphaproteobacteria bacterium]|nr:MAG: hypothetical protein COB49_11490 [Alphaproteobacteria bacterium]